MIPPNTRTAIKGVLLFVAAVIPVFSFGWEVAEDITSTPLLRGVPVVAEFRRKALDFGPGAPPRVVRMKGVGPQALSLDECADIDNELVGQLDHLERYRLTGVAFDGQPRYVANLRMFLVSIDPPVMVVIPHVFSLKHSEPNIRNTYLQGEMNGEYLEFSKAGNPARPRAIPVHLLHWLNYLELSRHLPSLDGAEVISSLWRGTISIREALGDSRFPLTAVESTQFPGFFEFRAK